MENINFIKIDCMNIPIYDEDGSLIYIKDLDSEENVGLILPEGYIGLILYNMNPNKYDTLKGNKELFKDHYIGSSIVKRIDSMIGKNLYWTGLFEMKGLALIFKEPKDFNIKPGIYTTCGGFKAQFVNSSSPIPIRVTKCSNSTHTIKKEDSFVNKFSKILNEVMELPQYCYPLYEYDEDISFINNEKYIGFLLNQYKNFSKFIVFEYPQKKKGVNKVLSESLHFINDVFLYKHLKPDEIEVYYQETLKYEDTSFELVNFNEVKEEKNEYLWYPYIPNSSITLLCGDPGIGKSYLALYLASLISKGMEFPYDESNRSVKLGPSNVILQNGEDAKGSTIKFRLKQLDANMENILYIDETEKTFDVSNLEVLEKFLYKKKPKLVVIDPITQYLPKISMDRANEVRKALAPLAELAVKYKCAFLLIAHKNKNVKVDSLYRVLGSVDFVGICRSMLSVSKLEGRTFLKQEKSSTAEFGKTLEYKIDNNGLHFIQRLEDSILSYEVVRPIEEAKQFILEQLKNQEVLATDIRNMAYSEGISSATLNRAKKELGVCSCKKISEDGETVWVWKINLKGENNYENKKRNRE